MQPVTRNFTGKHEKYINFTSYWLTGYHFTTLKISQQM